ncbi:MAG: cytidine deaminase [Proteobacteria bacterium]|nr:cytidine deaminase [Pseudomonadota bacterium]
MPEDLLDAAFAARKCSHSPYSNFRVGAAVRTTDGRIFTGSNVESSSYGLTICAERLAICIAIHEGHKDITEIAVVADTSGAPGPCGACRQFMYDFAPTATVLMANLNGDRRTVNVGELIPWGFGPSDLLSFESRRGDSNE